MKEKHPFLVIPLIFYYSCPKLLDDATSIGSQGCPLFAEFVKGISIGIKHCWAQFPESRYWHNICDHISVNFTFGLNYWTCNLASVSSGNIAYIVKACDFCLCCMLWTAVVCDLALG